MYCEWDNIKRKMFNLFLSYLMAILIVYLPYKDNDFLVNTFFAVFVTSFGLLFTGYVFFNEQILNKSKNDSTLDDIIENITTSFHKKLSNYTTRFILYCVMFFSSNFITSDILKIIIFFIMCQFINNIYNFLLTLLSPSLIRDKSRELSEKEFNNNLKIDSKSNDFSFVKFIEIFKNIEKHLREIYETFFRLNTNNLTNKKIINNLFYSKFIEKDLYSELISLNKYRNYLIHGECDIEIVDPEAMHIATLVEEKLLKIKDKKI